MAQDLYSRLSGTPTHLPSDKVRETDPSTVHTARVETVDNDRVAMLLGRFL